MDFTERELQIVETLFETKNLSHAADKLYITQPALTKAINRLEEKLGVKLFDRMARPIQLTHAGTVYLEKARQVKNISAEMMSQFSMLEMGKKTTMRLGMSSARSARWLPLILPVISSRYPELEITISENRHANFAKNILYDELDLAIGGVEPSNLSQIHCEYLRNEDWVIVTSRSAPFLSNKDLSDNGPFNPVEISISDFKNCRFIFTEDPYIDTPINRIVEKCKKAYIPITTMRSTDITNAFFMAASGIGITFTNPYMTYSFKHLQDDAAYCFLKGYRDHPIYIFSRYTYPHPEYIDFFLATLRNILEENPTI